MPVPPLRPGPARRGVASFPWRRGWPALALAVAAGLIALAWSSWTPVLAPRHRPEALCFALAQARFAPPMNVEPSAAIVRGRFSPQTPAAIAVRQAMRFTDDMVLRERHARVGDYDVTMMWLRLPGRRGGHWLVVAWMEDSDLAVCSFRFAGGETDLTGGEAIWGNRLLGRILTPENFRAGALPTIRLRGEPPRSFGPKTEGG